jgi:quercetin dioxygenase-like cupin family protein
LTENRDAIAPDGSDVRILLGLTGAGMAHFQLPPGQTSGAVTHRTVEEIWFFLSGRGEMWRRQSGQPEIIVPVESGVCLTIPLGHSLSVSLSWRRASGCSGSDHAALAW